MTVDLFGRVPLRANDALKRGDLTPDGFLLISFLAGECWRNNGEAVFTLTALRDALHYAKSRDQLLRELKRLCPEWISFDVAPRQRAPYVIRLTGAGVQDASAARSGVPVRQPCADARQTGPADFEALLRLGNPPQLMRGASSNGSEEKRKIERTYGANELCSDCKAHSPLETYGAVHVCSSCAATRAAVARRLG